MPNWVSIVLAICSPRCPIPYALAISMLLDLRFDLADPLQGLIPAPFEFIGHQPILRIGSIELLLCPPRAVPGSLQVALKCGQDFVDLASLLFVGHDRRLDCCRLYHAQDLPRNRLINDQTRKADAARLAIIEPSATAVIPQHVVMAAGVMHHQLMAAAATAQQAGQQRVRQLYPPKRH